MSVLLVNKRHGSFEVIFRCECFWGRGGSCGVNFVVGWFVIFFFGVVFCLFVCILIIFSCKTHGKGQRTRREKTEDRLT